MGRRAPSWAVWSASTDAHTHTGPDAVSDPLRDPDAGVPLMLLAVLLIHSDAGGHPNVNGGHLHFVEFCPDGQPVPVNQMTLQDLYRNFDCGVAVVKSIAAHYGRSIPSDRTIEWDEGNTGGGCTLQGIVNGLAACGLVGHIVFATPGAATIMNPAWGGVIPMSQAQSYINAAVVGFPGGWAVTVDPPNAPPPQPKPTPPPPPPPPPKGVAMHWLFWHDVQYNGKPISAAFLSDGRRYWWLLSEAVLADVRFIYKAAEAACGFKLLIEYNQVGTPLADLSAFGLPDNQATADLVGQPYLP